MSSRKLGSRCFKAFLAGEERIGDHLADLPARQPHRAVLGQIRGQRAPECLADRWSGRSVFHAALRRNMLGHTLSGLKKSKEIKTLLLGGYFLRARGDQLVREINRGPPVSVRDLAEVGDVGSGACSDPDRCLAAVLFEK